MNAGAAEQSHGDVAMGRAGVTGVGRAEDEDPPSSAAFGRIKRRRQAAKPAQRDQAAQGEETMAKLVQPLEGIAQADRPFEACAGAQVDPQGPQALLQNQRFAVRGMAQNVDLDGKALEVDRVPVIGPCGQCVDADDPGVMPGLPEIPGFARAAIRILGETRDPSLRRGARCPA